MHNRINKVEVVGEGVIKCTFYSGDVLECDISQLEDFSKLCANNCQDSLDNEVVTDCAGRCDGGYYNPGFDKVRITNNGDCLKWENGFQILAQDIWECGHIVENGYPEPKYQMAMLMSYYRELYKLTQKDLQELTGISQSDISRYERGEGNPSFDTMNRIANAFGRKVQIDYVLLPGESEIDLSEFEGAKELFEYLPKWKKQGQFTIKDIEDTPEEYRLELIDGVIRMMGTANLNHQIASMHISAAIWDFIKKNKGKCLVLQTPALIFDSKDIVNTYLVPDIAIVCDRKNINKRGIINHVDFIAEIVSPGDKNRIHDYKTKLHIYMKAGVREYWIVDPERQKVTVFSEKDDYMPTIYGFDCEIPVGIYNGELQIDMREVAENMED